MSSYPDLDMYIQPGGDAYLAQKWIGASGKARINDFLAGGGSYFGACAGWYFAAGDYVWQDNYYEHANLLGAYPQTVEGGIREVADYDVGPGYTITATAIRFMCEAGAVSEGCWVDNVRIFVE